MSKYSTATLMITLLVIICGSACAQVYPSVELTSFDPITYTYVYTVTCPADNTYQFGYLQIDTQVTNPSPTGSWTISGPFVGGVNKLWPTGTIQWDSVNGKDSAIWDPISRGMVIPANTAWQGTFILVVPESEPVPGKAATKDGQIGSYKVHDVLVPGPKGDTGPSGNPPTTTINLDGTTGTNDWYISPVNITLSYTDPENDWLVSNYAYKNKDALDWLQDWDVFETLDTPRTDPLTISSDGLYEFYAYSEDSEGNKEDPPVSKEFKIDATPPLVSGVIVTQANANGWYNGDVQVNYTAKDALSGLAEPEAAEKDVEIQFGGTITGEGQNVEDTGSATDNAGNVGSCTVKANIDRTAPSITIISAPTGDCHLINYEKAVVQFSVTDSGSGIDGLPTGTATITPTDSRLTPYNLNLTATSIGPNLYEVSFSLDVPANIALTLSATDKAGNTGQLTEPVQFGTGGFTVEWLPPICLMDTYLMQDGSTIPVKFRLTDPCNNNALVNNYDYTLVVNYNSPTGEKVLKGVYTPQYDPSVGGYQVNVKTKDGNNVDWALGDYTITIVGPGIWDTISGPYKSSYGLQLVDKSVAKGVGRR